MVQIDVKVDDHQLASAFFRKGNQVNSEIDKLTVKLTDIAQRWVQNEAPRKTGRLKKAVQKNTYGSRGLVFLSKSIAPYWIFVIDGTRPHDIKPKNGKALFWPGAKHPVKVVHHKGTKANPFVDKAFPKMQGDIERAVSVFQKWLESV
jgi:hypothetical protein